MVSLYSLMNLIASEPIGTNLSLSPLPMTLIKPTSRYRQDIFKLIASVTLNPELYIVSKIALLRPPSGLLKSICAITCSISSKLNTSGSFLLVFGEGSKVVGLMVQICSNKQYLKKDLIPEIILACEVGAISISPIHCIKDCKCCKVTSAGLTGALMDTK